MTDTPTRRASGMSNRLMEEHRRMREALAEIRAMGRVAEPDNARYRERVTQIAKDVLDGDA